VSVDPFDVSPFDPLSKFVIRFYLRPPKGERSDTPAAHVASVRGEGVTDYMTTDGNARL
jgi:hypothetical protein